MDTKAERGKKPEIMELIAGAPWREAVTYRETWPHEYVVVKKDGQEELLAAFCKRINTGAKGSTAGSSTRSASTCSSVTTSTGR